MAPSELTYTPIIGANGKATVDVKVANGFDTWTISQVSIEMPAAGSGATCWLRKGAYPITPMVASGDTAAGEPYAQIGPFDKLTVEWAGCPPNATGKVLVFYDDGR